MLNANAFYKNIDTHFLLSGVSCKSNVFRLYFIYIFIPSICVKQIIHAPVNIIFTMLAQHKIHWILTRLKYRFLFHFFFSFSSHERNFPANAEYNMTSGHRYIDDRVFFSVSVLIFIRSNQMVYPKAIVPICVILV